MEKRESIQRLWELHVEGAKDILKAYDGEDTAELEDFEKNIIEFENSISHELGVVKKALYTISEALKEISDDLSREVFYLGELKNSEGLDYQGFVSREYGLLIDRLLANHQLIEENYRLLEEKKEVWKGIMEKLRVLTDTYPHINENMERQYEILEEIIK